MKSKIFFTYLSVCIFFTASYASEQDLVERDLQSRPTSVKQEVTILSLDVFSKIVPHLPISEVVTSSTVCCDWYANVLSQWPEFVKRIPGHKWLQIMLGEEITQKDLLLNLRVPYITFKERNTVAGNFDLDKRLHDANFRKPLEISRLGNLYGLTLEENLQRIMERGLSAETHLLRLKNGAEYLLNTPEQGLKCRILASNSNATLVLGALERVLAEHIHFFWERQEDGIVTHKFLAFPELTPLYIHPMGIDISCMDENGERMGGFYQVQDYTQMPFLYDRHTGRHINLNDLFKDEITFNKVLTWSSNLTMSSDGLILQGMFTFKEHIQSFFAYIPSLKTVQAFAQEGIDILKFNMHLQNQ